MKKDIDFIIVGSGPGGATVAKGLGKNKLSRFSFWCD